MKTAEAHNAELTGSIKFVKTPLIPDWDFIEAARKAAEAISAKIELLPAVHIKRHKSTA